MGVPVKSLLLGRGSVDFNKDVWLGVDTLAAVRGFYAVLLFI